MNPFETLSCEAANYFGWQVGGASATLAAILLLLRIALAPALGPQRKTYVDRFFALRRLFRYLIWLMPVAWLMGAVTLDGFTLCYARGVANAATIVLGVFLFISILTAANQIGRRSLR